ncbi:MAG: mannose-1-phosphate guanylyltransferase/mannose-6-phosphate isomerase [bacterium]
MSNIYGVILAGGSGSRLWPLSREMYPKQLLKLNDDNTLFQSSFLRLSNVIRPENILTVTNTKQSSDIKLQLSQLKETVHSISDFRTVIEPIGRNTAPAIALSVLYILKKMSVNHEDAIICISPADHLIKDKPAFEAALNEGIKLAENGYIATFGIKPDKPDTGYGYINTEKNSQIEEISSVGVKACEFKEKPDYETAVNYVESGVYYWNSGIFVFKASVILEELIKYYPEIYNKLEKAELYDNGPTVKFDEFMQLPDISIDYAVMEKSSKLALIPVDCGWNDMGSWEAIYDTAQKDEKNNFMSGNVVDIDSEDSLVFGTSKLVSTIGLKNIVVVETEDAVLVCDKDRTQDVKKVFDKLKVSNDNTYKIHKTVYRPWGFYTVLQEGPEFKTKMIQVNPGAKLSLQMHYHRSEHWVVLSGTAKVRKGETDYYLKPGDSIDIPATVKHFLENPGKVDVQIIEVQTGHYLEEDDIVRFEDIYGRIEA